jgi:hypothetical protein
MAVNCFRESRPQRPAAVAVPPLFAPLDPSPSGFQAALVCHLPLECTLGVQDSAGMSCFAVGFEAPQANAHAVHFPPYAPSDFPPSAHRLRVLLHWQSPVPTPPQGHPCGRRRRTGSMLSISVYSWLAGIESAVASELLLPFPAPWALLSLADHHPVLSLLWTLQHNCPPLLHSAFRSFRTTMRDSDSCSRRIGLPLWRGCAAR